jgi:hypothetical protein
MQDVEIYTQCTVAQMKLSGHQKKTLQIDMRTEEKNNSFKLICLLLGCPPLSVNTVTSCSLLSMDSTRLFRY